MSVIFAANLIEGPVLVSDCRATSRQSKAKSDTATKILPLTSNLIVGVVGNPIQAGVILENISKKVKEKGESCLQKDSIKKTVIGVLKNTDIVSIQSSKCQLIFAGQDKTKHQFAPLESLKEHFEKENKPILMGHEGLHLANLLMRPKVSGLAEFAFPESFIYSFSYPEINFTNVPVLRFKTWGSGGDYIKEKMRKDFHRLWDLETYKAMPSMKLMILAISFEKDLKEAPEELCIGGLPQVVTLLPNGEIFFMGYQKGGPDGKYELSMKYENGYWTQKNLQNGHEVKTLPSLFATPDFKKENILDFSL